MLDWGLRPDTAREERLHSLAVHAGVTVELWKNGPVVILVWSSWRIRSGADPFTVDDAIVLAAFHHRGQRDKGRPTLPYITHPMRVMARFNDPLLQTIAMLHDAVEDTALTLDQLRAAGASDRLLRALDAITHRHQEPDETYWDRVRCNRDALRVKLVDIEDNDDPRRLALLEPTKAAALHAKYARALTVLRRT